MQCGVETMNDCERSPGRQGLRVNFTEKGEVKERREKFLTAKYGSHQMSLIRKRLAVEMWLYDELQKLFDPPNEAVDVDIDEILDMDTDDIRRTHLFSLLSNSTCKRSEKDISKFITDLLDRAKTL
ncbi:CLUMA_CG015736, isoform A [Clunio marinus]|uniref:CLUMA_CG015736, isoform A n=1 Tax=Clunio marinus TaxID=568069 RepID=A0A1J1ISZ8_9DIPT|nr:CLUMA_CG015736, isoform A [Clunio marinus]